MPTNEVRWNVGTQIDRAVSVVIGCAAVAVAIAAIHREFFSPVAGARSPIAAPELVDGWRDFVRAGLVMGSPTARVQIVEFADFQCPFCKTYEETLRQVEQRYPRDVSRVFVHFPLSMHQHAHAAARAAECAHEQGRFAAMQAALYAKQDSIGARSWVSYAGDAGVPDSAEFRRCAERTDPVRRIEDGMALARKLNLGGTPTVIVNGWKFVGGPPDSVLTRTIEALIAGKQPPDVDR